MTIKELLLSKPDGHRFKIDYVFENFCPECKRNIEDLDEEYSTDGTVEDLRKQVAGTCTGFNHYFNYEFVYEDYTTDDEDVTIEETDTETVITITKQGEPQTCEECEQKHLDELAADAVEPEPIILPTAEEIKEDMRKYNELLTWAQSLTPEQIAFLCDGGWYNSAMKGYAIRAAREMDLDEDQTREFVRNYSYALDMMKKDEAERLYMDF